jgi:hypothetical protein
MDRVHVVHHTMGSGAIIVDISHRLSLGTLTRVRLIFTCDIPRHGLFRDEIEELHQHLTPHMNNASIQTKQVMFTNRPSRQDGSFAVTVALFKAGCR